MYEVKEEILSKADILSAIHNVVNGPLVVHHTPCIEVVNAAKKLRMVEADCQQLFLKLENMQTSQSFKIRGVSNQFQVHDVGSSRRQSFVTMSAGNYGKAFSYASKQLGLTGNTVLMPDTAPAQRGKAIEEMGVRVRRMPSARLIEGVKELETNEGATFLHPFDDRHLIAGYGSLGAEILQDVPDVDVVVVCCGGGGLLAGTATALAHLSQRPLRIFGVEPETACGMHTSLKMGKAASCPQAHSVAAGLAPPFAGENAFRHVKNFVEDIILVTDKELMEASALAFQKGLVVEASGAAALAAITTGKLEAKIGTPEFRDKKVVAVITGSNVTPLELVNMFALID